MQLRLWKRFSVVCEAVPAVQGASDLGGHVPTAPGARLRDTARPVMPDTTLPTHLGRSVQWSAGQGHRERHDGRQARPGQGRHRERHDGRETTAAQGAQGEKGAGHGDGQGSTDQELRLQEKRPDMTAKGAWTRS